MVALSYMRKPCQLVGNHAISIITLKSRTIKPRAYSVRTPAGLGDFDSMVSCVSNDFNMKHINDSMLKSFNETCALLTPPSHSMVEKTKGKIILTHRQSLARVSHDT